MQLYAITDGQCAVSTSGWGSRDRLLALVRAWTAAGVPYVQLREKGLDPAQLTQLAADIRGNINPQTTRLLINLPAPELASVALAAGADGVHLAGRPQPGAVDAVRHAFRHSGRVPHISLPCHSLEEVKLAREQAADLILFSPVFEKLAAPPQGLEALSRACAAAAAIPVFALGGVNASNAAACLAAGAGGIAGIRLFVDGGWRELAGS